MSFVTHNIKAGWLRVAAVALACACSGSGWGQAAQIPSAAAGPVVAGENAGRRLLDLMVQALGGDAWLHRKDWTVEGRAASFYKGEANPGVTQFEEFHRADPFAVRVEIISKMGVFIPTAKRDIIQLWTADKGYEFTYRGRKESLKEDVVDYERRRKHSLDEVVRVWLKQPGVEVVYEGTSMVARHLADKVTVLSANNDAVTLELDETTHLPLSRTFDWRNETFKDKDVDREEYDDYHPMDGLMTALTITRFRNSDMVSQRYFTKVKYNTGLSNDLFDPDKVVVKR